MERSSGRPEVKIGLIDGPVLLRHADLAGDRIQEIPGRLSGSCRRASSAACEHGTYVAGILCGRRGSVAPAIAPDCTLLVRPIFTETIGQMPSATPEELAAAIAECIDAGARVLNVSAALASPSCRGERALAEALDYAGRRGVIAVAAAGNQGTLGSTTITRHSWVVPVTACDLGGRPMGTSNLGHSIGRRGLSAPGDNITSLGTEGRPVTSSGTSVATPFVTGAVALLWSAFPTATAAQVKLALVQARAPGRAALVPPRLDAWGAFEALAVDSAR